MAKILAVADMGAPTGFATVAQNILERLVTQHGHDVHILAVNWRGDYVDTPLKMYVPNNLVPQDIYGDSRLIEMMGRLVPDALLFINDPQIILNSLLRNEWDPEKVVWRGFPIGETTYKPPIIAYLPIDGYDTPQVWDILKERATRVAMSHFAQETMTEAPVIWHGVDTDVFKPMNKTEAKRIMGFDPDRFLVLRVDKNSFRKNYPDTWRALRPVMRKYTDIDVQFHCLPAAPDGFNLRLFMVNDTDIHDRVTFSPNLGGFSGWTEQNLATLYSAADVFVSTSGGEGFGLTLLEAMACGTPVIATDCSAITEVVGPGGILIPPARRTAVPMGQDQMLPDVEAFSREIEHLYQAGGTRRKLGEKAVEHARQFSWDIAAAKFNDIIHRETNT